jgi:hypothetical protein
VEKCGWLFETGSLFSLTLKLRCLRWCSGSSRNAVRLPSGTSVQLHRNPQNERNALKIMELVGSRRENANQHPALASHSFVPCGFRVKTQAEGAPLHAHRNSLVPASSHRVFPVRVPGQQTLPGTFENKVFSVTSSTVRLWTSYSHGSGTDERRSRVSSSAVLFWHLPDQALREAIPRSMLASALPNPLMGPFRKGAHGVDDVVNLVGMRVFLPTATAFTNH